MLRVHGPLSPELLALSGVRTTTEFYGEQFAGEGQGEGAKCVLIAVHTSLGCSDDAVMIDIVTNAGNFMNTLG